MGQAGLPRFVVHAPSSSGAATYNVISTADAGTPQWGPSPGRFVSIHLRMTAEPLHSDELSAGRTSKMCRHAAVISSLEAELPP